MYFSSFGIDRAGLKIIFGLLPAMLTSQTNFSLVTSRVWSVKLLWPSSKIYNTGQYIFLVKRCFRKRWNSFDTSSRNPLRIWISDLSNNFSFLFFFIIFFFPITGRTSANFLYCSLFTFLNWYTYCSFKETIIYFKAMYATSPIDQWTISLSGQIAILAGHCPLTSRYLEPCRDLLLMLLLLLQIHLCLVWCYNCKCILTLTRFCKTCVISLSCAISDTSVCDHLSWLK